MLKNEIDSAYSLMKILVSVNTAWNAWNFRKALIEALIEEGHSVTILGPKDHSVPALKKMGCRFRHLGMSRKGLNPLEDGRLILDLQKAFSELQPDIILSFTIKNNIYGSLVAKRLGIPFVPNVTGLGTAFMSRKTLQQFAIMLYKLAFRNLPIVFFQNEDDQSLFVARSIVGAKQTRLLPGSGIDLDWFSAMPYPDQTKPPIFLMIARLLRDKGVFEFVDAARQVKDAAPSVQFRLLGPLDNANRSAVSNDDMENWVKEGVVEYLGTAEDVRPHIATAHCVVLPSYREGAPRTLIEAAAMARPLIATDVPGCRSVIDHGVTGFLCKPKSAEALAQACFKMLQHETEARAAMGQAGRLKMMRTYDQKFVVEAYQKVIKEFL